MRNIFLALVGITFFMGCSEENKETSPIEKTVLPNIVWLVAEDQSPEWFPMYGDTTIALPNLQMLANDGVTYENAYSPAPVCAPARSAIITGMYPTTLGTHNMRAHASWRGVNNEPTIGIPSYSPVVPEGARMFTEYLRAKGYYCANGPKEDYNFEKTDAAWDESSDQRHWRKRKDGQPFFTVFNFKVCHESQIWKRGKDSLFVNPKDVPVPPYFPDNDTIRHDLAVNYSNLKRLDDQIGEVLAQLKEDGLYENSIIFFYGDHGGPFPRHKRALYETGTKVPMVIKFAANMDAGSRDDRFLSFIDLAPTVLSLAGIKPPKVMQGKAQFGTFEAVKKPRYTFHASDRFDAVYDRLRAVRGARYKYIKSFNADLPHALPVTYREQMPTMRNLRALHASGDLNDEQAAWLNSPKPEEELYDLKKDPYELHNLAAVPALADTLLFYRKLLSDWMTKTNDLGGFPEKELLAKWLPKGVQPALPPLEMEEKGDSIVLLSKKSDATIVWKRPQDSIWSVYSTPLPNKVSFEAKAERIGFIDSDTLRYRQ